MDYASFLRQRITELRMKRNVSEYQMSLELGQNKNYIQGISSGKALPSMTQFFNICDYFCITPEQYIPPLFFISVKETCILVKLFSVSLPIVL